MNSNSGFCKRPKTLICYICGREYGTTSLPIHVKSCEQKWEQQQMLLPKNQRRPLPNPPPGFAQLMGKNTVTMQDADFFNEQAFDTYKQEGLVKCPYCNRTFNQDRIEIHGRICTRDKPFKPLPGAGAKQQMNDPHAAKQYQQPQKKKYNQYEEEPDELESFPMYQKGQLKQKQQQEYEMPSQKKGILKKGKQNLNEQDEYNYSGGGAMLMACKYCDRKFNPDRIEKHENACRKMKKQPKKVKYFGAFGKKAGGGPPIKQKPNKKPASKWRQEHEEFISGLKAARSYSNKGSGSGVKGGYVPQPSAQNSSLIPCPHCGRRFNECQTFNNNQSFCIEAAERHIPKCVNIINKPKGPASSYIKPTQQKKKDYFDDNDDYDPFQYKEPKISQTQKQNYRKQFQPDQYQAPPTVKQSSNKASTTTKKQPQKPQQYDDLKIGGGGGGGSYLEKLESHYNKGGRNAPAKPVKQTYSPKVQFVGGGGGSGGSQFNNKGGIGGGGGGAFDATSNAHSRNLIFADSGYGNTYQPNYNDIYQTTYQTNYSNQKQNQNVFSVPGQQKSYVEAPFQTQQNQGYQKQSQNASQPKGYKYDF